MMLVQKGAIYSSNQFSLTNRNFHIEANQSHGVMITLIYGLRIISHVPMLPGEPEQRMHLYKQAVPELIKLRSLPSTLSSSRTAVRLQSLYSVGGAFSMLLQHHQQEYEYILIMFASTIRIRMRIQRRHGVHALFTNERMHRAPPLFHI